MTEKTIVAATVHRCEHHCPLCDEIKPHEATVDRPCIFLTNRVCDDCVEEQIRLIEIEHSLKETL